jgi:glucitol/sorbitol PTS system EIIA component
MTIKYQASVQSIGEMAAEFAEEGILVFFGPDAPEELHEFAIITQAAALASPIETGDVIELDGVGFEVLCVGPVANDNLAGLGHLVVKFNGLVEPELPGDVSLPKVAAPRLTVGSTVTIVGRDA